MSSDIETGQDESGITGRIRKENETRILKAAEQVFADHGFRGATTAAIAEVAGLPKANIHYYFKTKSALYHAVLEDILELWLSSFRDITANDDPAKTLSDYIRAKMKLSQERPEASRVFANELIRGAPRIEKYLATVLRHWVDQKAGIIDNWIEQGRIKPLDSKHLLFHIWAMTQTWADFEAQYSAVLEKPDGLKEDDFEQATDAIIQTIFRACGLD